MKHASADNSALPARLAASLAGLVPALVFLPALTGGFLIWDDNVNLLSNAPLWESTGALRWMFTDVESVQRYKPLNWLLWRLVGDWFGLNPVAYHAINIVLHSANTVLLFHVISRFLRSRSNLNTHPTWILQLGAVAGALAWALHPLRVEPVAWISGAGYPLSTSFGLIAVLLFQHHLQTPRRPSWPPFVSFVLALLCYPAIASLPGLLLILFFLSTPSCGPFQTACWRRALLVLFPYIIASAIVLGLTFATRLTTGGEVWHRPVTLEATGLWNRAIHAIAAWVWYLEKTILPLRLAPVYVEFRDFQPDSFRGVASVLILVLTGFVAWVMRWRWPEVGPLWIACLLLAVPALGVTDLPFTPSDRYTYIPGMALALLLSVVIVRGMGSATMIGRRVVPIGVALLIVVLAAGSFRQLNIWRSPITFFQHAQSGISPHPATADLHWRLGLHYLTMERPDDAQNEFISVLRLNPHHADAARYLRVLRDRSEKP
jgi:protein O-mannosyl-transferase